MYCTMCGKRFFKHSYLISHIRLKHQHSANFRLACAMNCGKTFKVLSSYTSHISKVHFKLSKAKKDYKTASLHCCYCNSTCLNLFKFVSHSEKHMKAGMSVECPIRNCVKSYQNKSSLYAHIYKQHRVDKSIKNNLLVKQPQFSDTEILPDDSASKISCSDVMPDDAEVISETCESVNERIALFFLKLQAKHLVPSSTITVIAEGFKDLMSVQSSVWLQNIKNELNSSSTSVNFAEPSFETIVNTDIFNCMSTSHNRLTYYSNYFQFVKPVTYALGRNQYHEECSFQYVSIIESLVKLLQHKDISKQLNQERNAVDDIFTDFSDGSFCKENSLFASQSRITLKLLFYFDEFCIVNPIGAHRKNHKIASFYWTLGNLDFHSRSSLNLIQLGILCRNRDLKYFGLEAILYPLIRDLKILSNEGVFVPDFGHFYAAVPFICGDNLGSHFLGGFMECFSPNVKHFCRTCTVTSDEMQYNFNVATFQIRNPSMYSNHIKALQQSTSQNSECGIKRNSPLNEIPGYHVTTGLPPDAMHDILEGIVPYETSLVLQKLIADGYFTLDFLNRRILSLSYGKHDVLSKPVEQTLKNQTLIGTASTNWCLLRLLPILIGSKVPIKNEYWQFLLDLKELVEIIFAPAISIGHIDSLQYDIVIHLENFKKLFPSNLLKPKHHFLLHYPLHILNYGPPIRYWCFRFEAKHRFFKEVARYCKQFRNPPFTLANSHQLYQCYLHQSDQGYLKSQFECPSSESLCLGDLNFEALRAMKKLEISLDVLFQANTVIIKGTAYTLQMFVVVDFINGDIVFGEILKILVYKERAWFLIRKHISEKLPNMGCHKLTSLEIYDCVEQSELLDYYPLSSYTVQNYSVISLKHFVFHQEDYLK